MTDEWALLRRRQEDLRRRLDTLGRSESQPATRLGQVYSGGSIPTSLPGVFLMHPVRPSGNEAEGATPSFAVDTGSSFAATVVGRRVPVAGDRLVCRLCSGRWVAQTTGTPGGGTHPIPNCACPTTPDVVTLTKTGAGYQLQNCTLQYQPSPSGYSPGDGWWSNQEFSDGTNNYRLVLTCRLSFYAVDVSYTIASGLSGAGPFNIVKWSIGASGNTCSPLHMHNGLTISATEASFGITDAEING